jgi:hypothetical protein
VDDILRLITETAVIAIFLAKIIHTAKQSKHLCTVPHINHITYFYQAIVAKGFFRIFFILILDLIMIILGSTPAVPSNTSKLVRLAGNSVKLSLFVSDYLDRRFLIDLPASDEKPKSSVAAPSTPTTPTPVER